MGTEESEVSIVGVLLSAICYHISTIPPKLSIHIIIFFPLRKKSKISHWTHDLLIALFHSLRINEFLIGGCSSLGQGLLTSTFVGEIMFAIVVATLGLVLFALLIGNMQVSNSNLSNLISFKYIPSISLLMD